LTLVSNASRRNGRRTDPTEDAPAPGETPYRVARCVFCGHTSIESDVDGRFVTTTCSACQAMFVVEFDPPDAPDVRARIERIVDTP